MSSNSKVDAIEKAFSEIDLVSKKLYDKVANGDTDNCYIEPYKSPLAGDVYHKYLLDPSIINPDLYRRPILEQVQYLSLPKKIDEEMEKIKYFADMGIIPEIYRVWVAIDNKLFIWNYMIENSSPEEYLGFDNQIVSVSIAAPKPGTFQSSVKYILVVATTTEISLLMLTWDKGHIQLIPTQYKTASDDLVIKKIVGSQSGRIFMGGFDGIMYELYYENVENSWPSLFRVGAQPPRFKCQKISHKSWLKWGFIGLGELLIPPILKADDGLRDICIDDVRNVLYTMTTRGNLTIYDLGLDGLSTSIVVECNFYDKIREKYNNVSRIEGGPTKKTFEDDSNSYFSGDQNKDNGNTVLCINVLPVTESRYCHAVVILKNGVRVYIQLQQNRRNCFHEDLVKPHRPDSFDIVHIRSPPESTTIECCVKKEVDGNHTADGVSPNIYPNQNRRTLSKAFYSHGILLAAVENKGPVPQYEQDKMDLLVGFCQDLGSVDHEQHTKSYREHVCVVDRSKSKEVSRIYDIRESVSQMHCSEAIKMRSLFSQSRTPGNEDTGLQHLSIPKWDKDGLTPSEPPATSAVAIAFACQQPGLGISKGSLQNIDIINNLPFHQMPTTFSMQRKFLCLTNKGLHVVSEIRPIDHLYNILSNNASEELIRKHCSYFFEQYGPIQASAMCFSLACGIPSDVGGSVSLDPTLPVHVNLLSVKNVAIRITKELGYALPTGIQKQLTNYDDTYGHQLNWTSVEDSVRCRALRLVASRILRPIWFRPIVQSTGNSGNIEISPIWTRPLIHSIRQPLIELQHIIYACYEPTIKERERQTPGDNSKKEELLMGGIKKDKDMKQLDEKKKLEIEAKNCESLYAIGLYRLVQRSVQALSLLDFFLKAKGVLWEKLSSKSFKAIVCNSSLHKNGNIKEMIISVLKKATENDLTSSGLRLAEELTRELSRDCFLYFSSGDKYAQDAKERYKNLMKEFKTAISRNDPQILKKAQETIDLLINASQYWQSLSDVGSGANGTLTTYCEMLMTLAEVGRNGVVDLCLATSRNFRSSRIEDSILNANLKKIGDGDVSFNVDRNIYHLGRVLDADEMLEGCTACFNVLLDQVMSLKAVNTNDNEYFMIQMIDRALNKRSLKDDHKHMTMFQQLLCNRLILQDRDFLFNLKHKFVEEYLAQQVDKAITDMQNHVKDGINISNIHNQDYNNILESISKSTIDLNQYYKKNNLYIQAASKWYEFGCISNLCDIECRIEFFNKALSCANEAGHQNITEMMTSTGRRKAVADFIQDVQSRIEEATFQKDVQEILREDNTILSNLPSIKNNPKAMENLDGMRKKASTLKFQMVTRNDVYQIAFTYKIFEVCVLMLQNDDYDKNHHDQMWRSYIYR